MAHPTSFAGFHRDGFDFLAGLAAHNSKDYFESHRSVYEESLMDPAKAFVDAIGEALRRRVSPAVRAEPRVNGSIFRINRDTRFSKDKTPYKTHLDFVFWEGEGRSRECPAFYLRLAPKEVVLGAGMIKFDKEKLAAYRRAVVDPKSGAALDTSIAAVTGSGEVEIRGVGYKKVPRGFDADHPRAGLLMHDGLHAQFKDRAHPAELTRAGFVDWCVDRYGRLDPLQRWIVDTLYG